MSVSVPTPVKLCMSASLDGKIEAVRDLIVRLATEVNAEVMFLEGHPALKTVHTDASGKIDFVDAPTFEDLEGVLMDPGEPVIQVTTDGLNAVFRVRLHDGTTREDELPLGTRSHTGLVMPSDLRALDTAIARITTLEAGAIGGGLYMVTVNFSGLTDPERDSAVQAVKGTPPVVGDAVIDSAGTPWRRTINGWAYTPSVLIPTPSGATVVVSSTEDGKVYIESDLSMSINGWHALQTAVSDKINAISLDNQSTGLTLRQTKGMVTTSVGTIRNVSDSAGTGGEQRLITRDQYDALKASSGLSNVGNDIALVGLIPVAVKDIPYNAGTTTVYEIPLNLGVGNVVIKFQASASVLNCSLVANSPVTVRKYTDANATAIIENSMSAGTTMVIASTASTNVNVITPNGIIILFRTFAVVDGKTNTGLYGIIIPNINRSSGNSGTIQVITYQEAFNL